MRRKLRPASACDCAVNATTAKATTIRSVYNSHRPWSPRLLPAKVKNAAGRDAQVAVRKAVSREDADAVSVRLGVRLGSCQAQLDGFKSRALRARAPMHPRHLYVTEWRALDVVAERTIALALVLSSPPRVSLVGSMLHSRKKSSFVGSVRGVASRGP